MEKCRGTPCIRYFSILSGFILILAIALSGCIMIPVSVPVPVAPQGSQPGTTIEQNSQPGVTASPPAETTVPETGITTLPGTPAPVPTVAFKTLLPMGTVYNYADNENFHSLSVRVSNVRMTTAFYYTSENNRGQPVQMETAEGEKFLLVGVDFYMTGILKEGKSSQFMTPLAGSFQIVHDGVSYGPLNISDMPGMTDYYIRDIGTLYRDRFIDKLDPGSGILIYEVPRSVGISDSIVAFCPKNLDSWAYSNYYRSPDNWDCEANLIGWTLR
jgi:hypothetical protein